MTDDALRELKVAVGRLAEDPGDQAIYLAGLGTSPLVDELALDYDDAYRMLASLAPERGLPSQFTSILEEIDEALRRMSHSDDRDVWQVAALSTQEWNAIRDQARTLLASWPD